MDIITIEGLEVFFRVGVPDAERSTPQRLLICLSIEHDFAAASATDDLTKTIDYYAVSQAILGFGEGQSWKLIEKLAADLATLVLSRFSVGRVTVEVKKFIIPEAKFVSVRVTRPI